MATTPTRIKAAAAFILACLATTTLSAAQLSTPQPLELLDAALTAPEQSYRGRMMVTEWSGKTTRAEEVEVSYSPTNRYRWEFLAPDGSVNRVAISDGSNEQILLLRPGKTVTGEAVRSSTKLMFPEREKELLLKNYRLSISGPDMVAGRKAWVLDISPQIGRAHV
jgi:outer membrane lipoprotein-sorting protein